LKRFLISTVLLKSITLVWFATTFATISAQNISVYVYDNLNNQPLDNVLVIDQNANFVGQSNPEGIVAFLHSIESESVLTFKLFGYNSTSINYKELNNRNFQIGLTPLIEELEPIELKSKKKPSEIFYSHFELWQGGIVAVSKSKNRLFVFNESKKPLHLIDIPEVNKDKLSTLYRDANNQIYLTGEKYVMQIHITPQRVYKYKTRKIEDFNKYIKNLELVTTNGTHIYRDLERVNYTMPVTLLKEFTFFNTNISFPKYHNCGTDYIAYQKGKDPQIIYTTIDTTAFYAADREFQYFVSGYIAAQGYPLDRRWGMQLHSYKTLFGRFKEMPLFNYHENILVFDVFNNQLVHLDANFKTDTSIYFDFTKSTRKIVALQDMDNERIWLFERQRNGNDYLYELINGMYKSKEAVYVDSFSRNVRVKNNWIFYLDDKYRIIRIPNTPQVGSQ